MTPLDHHIEAGRSTMSGTSWEVLYVSAAGDFRYLQTVAHGDLQIVSQTLDNQQWIVAYLMDDGPIRYYRYDRAEKTCDFLFTNRKDLEHPPLVRMQPVVIKARRRAEPGKHRRCPPRPATIRSIPGSRCRWCSTCTAVLGLAIPGASSRSTSFGLTRLRRAERELSRLDGLRQGLRQRRQPPMGRPPGRRRTLGHRREHYRHACVAISGGSYGGYATLVGLPLMLQLFACGVDIVGSVDYSSRCQEGNSRRIGQTLALTEMLKGSRCG